MGAFHHRRPLAAVAVGLTLALGAATPSYAVQPDEILADPALEARARGISHGLRCLVCQNQSIDDSDAPLARDLRLLVRERLTAGDSDGAVRDFIVARYGEFVLLRPPLAWNTLILWFAPFAFVLLGVFVVSRRAQSRAGDAVGAVALTTEEEARLKAALGDSGDSTTKN